MYTYIHTNTYLCTYVAHMQKHSRALTRTQTHTNKYKKV